MWSPRSASPWNPRSVNIRTAGSCSAITSTTSLLRPASAACTTAWRAGARPPPPPRAAPPGGGGGPPPPPGPARRPAHEEPDVAHVRGPAGQPGEEDDPEDLAV